VKNIADFFLFYCYSYYSGVVGKVSAAAVDIENSSRKHTHGTRVPKRTKSTKYPKSLCEKLGMT
jgi:hypothetical protein